MRFKSFILAAVLSIISSAAQAQGIWFAPGDDLNVRGVVSHPDFSQLFVDVNQWKTGARNVAVVQDRALYFVRTPAEKLQPILAFLKEHKIALAVSTQVVPCEDCGKGIEGMTSLRQVELDFTALKSKGVDVSYVVMDEPLYFGHDESSANACKFEIHEVAERVAKSVRLIRSFYPDMQFVLVEPVQGLKGGTFEFDRFLELYKFNLHELPISVTFDVKWQDPWQKQLPQFIQVLKKRGIAYSVIFNGRGINKTAPEWVACARDNATAFKESIKDAPDHIVIQTWNPLPRNILPESDPDTMTGLLKWYVNKYKLSGKRG